MTTSNIVLGKVPPHHKELEKAVLGACMIDSNCLYQLLDILRPESFYPVKHQLIFSAIFDLYADSEPIDLLTVANKLREKEQIDLVGGAIYLAGLTDSINSSANAEYHARLISEAAIKRQLIEACQESLTQSYKPEIDCFTALDEIENSITDIRTNNIKGGVHTLYNSTIDVIEELENMQYSPGVPSMISSLDNVTGGWQESDLIILAARPGMGKTAAAIAHAREAASQGFPVAFFSLEMSKKQLVYRFLSLEAFLSFGAMIPYEKIKKNILTIQEKEILKKAAGVFMQYEIFFEEKGSMSIQEFRTRCYALKRKFDIELVIADYLQLFSIEGHRNQTRNEHVGFVVKSMKATAKDLSLPIIALSQLSRNVESRGGDKRPALSDLRESGDIEQEADLVIMLHRPEYYGITHDMEGNSTSGKMEAILAKHRNGRLADLLYDCELSVNLIQEAKADNEFLRNLGKE